MKQEQIDMFANTRFESISSSDWKWKFADYPTEKNGLKVFSCFACGGGSTMGYKLAGCDVVGNCEIDERMNKIYLKNHHPRYNFLMDIRDFNNIPNEKLPDILFDLDILDGSPPCTTFSMAGKREKNWGKAKKFKEGQKEQILDDLSFIFIDTVNKLKPKTVIMENVEGLLKGNAFAYVERIYKKFNNIGYNVKHYLLKGEQMGIPQKRHRVFFIAIRKDIPFDLKRLDMSFNYKPITYGEIKCGTGKKVPENTLTYELLLKSNSNDKRLCDVLERLGEKIKMFNANICWNNNTLATLTAKCDNYRPKELTQISKEDIIHAQTFPEDYDFGKQSVKYICGMSVPPIMIKRIVTRLIEKGLYDYKLRK